MAHTPGPWALEDGDQPSLISVPLYDRWKSGGYKKEDWPFVAGAAWCNDNTADLCIDNPADVALICAAPDLLAALKALRKWHREEYQSNREIDAQADAAITKAESRG